MKLRMWIKRIHLYIAIFSAIPLAVMCLSGIALVYREAIEDFIARDYNEVEQGESRLTIEELRARVAAQFPQYELEGVMLPKNDTASIGFWVKDAPYWTVLYADPYTGKFIGERAWGDWTLSNLVWWLTDLHYSFKWGKPGSYFVGFCSLILFFSVLTGIYLWWPRKSRFTRHKFQLKRGKRWKQTAYNLHPVLGLYASVALLAITISGCAMTFWEPMKKLVHIVTLSPPPFEAPVQAPAPGQAYLPMEELVAKARSYLLERYGVSPRPEAAYFPTDKNIVVEFSLQGDEGLSWADHYHVYFNAQTAEFVAETIPQTFNRGETVVGWLGPIHFGTWGAYWGPAAEQATRVLWLLVAAVPLFLMVSGFSLLKKGFWKRR